MRNPPAKLHDVALYARVSTATVSRALTQPHKLRPDTLKRVHHAVKKLGYIAHGAARALASRKTMTIGAVIPTLDHSTFPAAVHALQKALEEAGYTLLIACHEFNAETEVRVARMLIERGVDGLLLVGTDRSPDLRKMINSLRLPCVVIWTLDTNARQSCVGFDNKRAAALVADHLAGLGHRRFAVITEPTEHNDRARDRIEGVRIALATRGIKLPPDRLIEQPASLDGGKEGLRAAFSSRTPPSAVICTNDVLAIGALGECQTLGVLVPEQLSITGFDDTELASLVSPGLTTLRVPTAEIGLHAARMLISRLARKNLPRHHEVGVELVVRGTTAPPPRGVSDLKLRERSAGVRQ